MWSAAIAVALALVISAVFGISSPAMAQDVPPYTITENPSVFPESANWSETYGDQGIPGEVLANGGWGHTWTSILKASTLDRVNQIGDTGVFTQHSCPTGFDGRKVGMFSIYVPAELIPDELEPTLDKIGWVFVPADVVENTYHLGNHPQGMWVLSELIWCDNQGTNPPWVVAFNPSDRPDQDPVENFAGPQYVPGKVNGNFQLTKVLDSAYDWKNYYQDGTTHQWSCPENGGLGYFTNYSPMKLLAQYPVDNYILNQERLLQIGYVIVPAYEAVETFKLRPEGDYLAETKPIWCKPYEAPASKLVVTKLVLSEDAADRAAKFEVTVDSQSSRMLGHGETFTWTVTSEVEVCIIEKNVDPTQWYVNIVQNSGAQGPIVHAATEVSTFSLEFPGTGPKACTTVQPGEIQTWSVTNTRKPAPPPPPVEKTFVFLPAIYNPLCPGGAVTTPVYDSPEEALSGQLTVHGWYILDMTGSRKACYAYKDATSQTTQVSIFAHSTVKSEIGIVVHHDGQNTIGVYDETSGVNQVNYYPNVDLEHVSVVCVTNTDNVSNLNVCVHNDP